MSKITPIAAALLWVASSTIMASDQIAEIEQNGMNNSAVHVFVQLAIDQGRPLIIVRQSSFVFSNDREVIKSSFILYRNEVLSDASSLPSPS